MAVGEFPIERGHVMMFARAIGDPNPIYYDEAAARAAGGEGIFAPPTFLIADMHFDPDSRLRPKIGEPWRGSGKHATTPQPGVSGVGGLHAEQHFEYVRPVRVGDVLTKTSTPGKTWEREGRRGGKMTFSETVNEFRDQDGELVVVTRVVVVRTERIEGQS